MKHYIYFLLNVIFFMPFIVILIKKHKKAIKKYKLYLIYALLFGIGGFFLVDPIAITWKAWGYDYSKTIGITIGSSVIEELLWAITFSPILALIVAIWSDKEKKKKLKWPTL